MAHRPHGKEDVVLQELPVSQSRCPRVVVLVLVLVFARAQSLPIFNRCISRLLPARASSCTAAPTYRGPFLAAPPLWCRELLAGGARVSSRGSDFRVCRKYLRGVERGETPPAGVILGKRGGRGERAFIGCSDRPYMLAANHPGHISFGTPSSSLSTGGCAPPCCEAPS